MVRLSITAWTLVTFLQGDPALRAYSSELARVLTNPRNKDISPQVRQNLEVQKADLDNYIKLHQTTQPAASWW